MTIWGTIRVGVQTAFLEMRIHWLRSMLSLTGVMLGVASLVTMLLLVGGINVYLRDHVGRWAGGVWIWSRQNPTDEYRAVWTRTPGLRFSDGERLEQINEHVQRFRREATRRLHVTIAGESRNVDVVGVGKEEYEELLRDVHIRYGRGFSPPDLGPRARSVIISWDLAAQIVEDQQTHGNRDASAALLIGKGALLGNLVFGIIGIYAPLDPNVQPWRIRNKAFIPNLAMSQSIIGFDGDPGSLELRLRNPDRIAASVAEVAMDLRGLHRGVEDFEYHTSDWLREYSEMFANISLLMSIISVLSLTVGGLGIMNVMLSSVNERVREIGTRKALGAGNLQIFLQFLIETITLSLVGGALGTMLGCTTLLFKDAIRAGTQGAIGPTIQPQHALAVFGVVVAIGVVFGMYPALKAFRLNPIDALHYE